MRYRFRKGGRKRLPTSLKKKRLRLMGMDTLRKRSPLPEPIEAIRLEEETKRAPFLIPILKRFLRSVSNFIHQLFSELRAAARKGARLIRRFTHRIGSFISKRIAERKNKKISSLPVLLGAVLSSFLVCTLTASYILLTLFIPYSKEYRSVKIPDLKGMKLTEIDLEGEDFNLIIQYENNPDVEDGRVISQIPSAGVTRKIYEKNGFCPISLKVSRHTSPSVPQSLVGSSLRDASLSLLCDGLSFTVTEKYSSARKGTVIGCYPAEGETIPKNGSITLTVSAGDRELFTSVPSLVGLTESEALFRINSSSLEVGEVTYARSDKKAGTVIFQSPSPYTTERQGQSVSFTVSAGAEFFVPTVPDLYGMTVEEAKQTLQSVGLTVSSTYSVSSGARAKTVISQSPIAGTPITSSITSVALYISN